ncbi:MAG: TetR family transcriptional regulator C-terminal domain-containing protein [Bacilli bacterium]|nr:TetR family transcriptional regulator C-terminal domain-containing protein [Bacilli bacterium]
MGKKDFSKRCIADSLFELLRDKEFCDITVKDITEKSGFSRMTYYRNFESIDEVLDYFLENYLRQFVARWNIDLEVTPMEDYMEKAFSYLLETREVGELLFRRGLIDFVRLQFNKHPALKTNDTKKAYYFSYIAGGVYNAYRLWIENGFRESPEELSHLLSEFIHRDTK